MSVICLRHFHCNGVIGEPGKVLTDEELVRIGNLRASLSESGLVKVDDLPVLPVASIDPVQAAQEPAAEAAASEVAPKPQKGKRRR